MCGDGSSLFTAPSIKSPSFRVTRKLAICSILEKFEDVSFSVVHIPGMPFSRPNSESERMPTALGTIISVKTQRRLHEREMQALQTQGRRMGMDVEESLK